MDFLNDLRIACRGLWKAPGQTLVTISVIALGTGVNLAVFAVVYGVLLRPLPYERADRLAILSVGAGDGTDFGIPADEVADWRRRLRSVVAVGAFSREDVVLRGDGEPRLVAAARVDEGFFDVLASPEARDATERFAGSADAVLSVRAARALFADRAVGRTLAAGDDRLAVTAVVPPAFSFPDATVEAWLPAATGGENRRLLVVRRRAGVGFEELRDDATRVLREIRGPEFGKAGSGFPIVTPLEEALLGPVRPALVAAGGAALLVLLVTCGNVALLRLGRRALRRRDAAVRLALGADRLALARGALAETLPTVVLGTLAGFVSARASLEVLALWAPEIPRPAEVTLGGPAWAVGAVLVFLVALVFLVTLVGSVATAGHERHPNAGSVLRGGRGGSSRKGHGLGALVVVQIAASLVLLAGAALLTRTLLELTSRDFGVETRGVLVAELHRPHGGDDAERVRFTERLLERARALPGARAAGLGSDLPPRGAPFTIYLRVLLGGRDEGRPFSVIRVTPGYFEALGIGADSGRLLRDHDRQAVVLSRSAASFLLPGVGAAGRDLSRPLPPVVPWSAPPRVTGVVSDVSFLGLDQPAPSAVYVPWRARPSTRSYLVVRADGDPAALAPSVRSLLRELDPRLPRPEIMPLEARVESSVAARRARAVTASAFAVVALAVALAGVLGLFLRLAAERRHEAAVRMALGATPSDVVRLMLRRASVLAASGVVLGVSGFALVADGLRHLLYGIGPLDPTALAAAVVTVTATALLAAYLPARRLESVAPAEALREE